MRRALIAGRGALLTPAAASPWSGRLPQSLDLDTLGRRLSCVEVVGWPERTAQHRRFNDRLRSSARAHGLRILDAAGSLPSAAGVVSPGMLGRAAGRDHHLDLEAVRPTVTAKLWDLVDGPKDTDG
jgi:hypothetical protein